MEFDTVSSMCQSVIPHAPTGQPDMPPCTPCAKACFVPKDDTVDAIKKKKILEYILIQLNK